MQKTETVVILVADITGVVAARRLGESEYFWSNQTLVSSKKVIEFTNESYKSGAK